MIIQQMSLEEIQEYARKNPEPPLPSFSEQVAAQNAAECPPEPRFKPSHKSIRAVFDAMKHGRYMTKPEIEHYSGVSQHAVSARLSDLKIKYGIPNQKRKAKEGSIYQYRLLLPNNGHPDS